MRATMEAGSRVNQGRNYSPSGTRSESTRPRRGCWRKRCQVRQETSRQPRSFPQGASSPKPAPVRINLDGCAPSHETVREMPEEDEPWKHTGTRSLEHLNNPIEEDRCGIEFETRPMLGPKNFDCTAPTIPGIELLHRIQTGQFALKDKLSQQSGARCSPCRLYSSRSLAAPFARICTETFVWRLGFSLCGPSVFPQPRAPGLSCH